jgi:hypothetical protein
MRLKILLAVAVISILASAGAMARAQVPVRPAVENYQFGNAVLYIVTKPKDSESKCGYALFEKAEVIRLGDRSFIVAALSPFGDSDVEKATAGKKVWTPVSEVVQMTEFKTMEDARIFLEVVRKSSGGGDRSPE